MKVIKGVDMKILVGILFLLLVSMAVSAHALSQEVQIDLLLNKITASLKADKPSDALPYFGELERMEPSLPKPLPESFYFYYIEALEKTGDRTKALIRADSYLNRYGKKGKNYDKVIEIMSRLQIQADKEAKEKAAEAEAAIKKRDAEASVRKAAYDKKLRVYQQDLDEYNRKIAACPSTFEERLHEAERNARIAQERCQASESCARIAAECEAYGHCTQRQKVQDKYGEFYSTRDILRYFQREGVDEYCRSRRPTEPTEPTMPK